MAPELAAALVAGAVSLILAATTAAATIFKTQMDARDQRAAQATEFDRERERQRAAFLMEREHQQEEFASERERQQVDLRRRMTDRLYERRIAVYPGLFAATAQFRRSVMKAAKDLPQHLRDAIAVVNAWHAGEGGLLLSKPAHQALLDLRHAVKDITEHDSKAVKLADAREHVWECKNRLRAAMRDDVVLLFEESETSTLRPKRASTGLSSREANKGNPPSVD